MAVGEEVGEEIGGDVGRRSRPAPNELIRFREMDAHSNR
jgi:hypothetical protein